MYLTARSLKRCYAAGLALAACIALAACGSSASGNPLTPATGSVVVGSANFPEDELVAQIYATALAAKGVKVTDQFNIGAREVYYPEIEKGAITIIPEYNGALLTTAVDPSSTAATTAQVDAQLKVRLPASLEILDPSPAQDKDSVTVTQAFATRYHLSSIAQLKPLAASMVFGAPSEFKTRADGQAGLRERYGVVFKGFDALDESGPITLKAQHANYSTVATAWLKAEGLPS